MKAENKYLNRELSWLEFNSRVLQLALNKKLPELERAKFYAIFSSNLDEFFMVRVAALLRRIELKDMRPDISGFLPKVQLDLVLTKVKEHLKLLENNYKFSLIPKLRKNSIRLLTWGDLSENQKNFVYNYFQDQVFPIIVPMASDLGHPFPVLKGKQLYFAIHSTQEKSKKKKLLFSIVPVPDKVLPRLVRLPSTDKSIDFIFIEEIIRTQIGQLYIGNKVKEIGLFRITRDAEFSLEEEEAEDLLKIIETQLKERRKGSVVRLEVEKKFPKNLLNRLQKELSLANELVQESSAPLDLSCFFEIYGITASMDLKIPKFQGITPPWAENSIFKAIREKDRFLHNPYHGFGPLVTLLEEAASDKKVLAIKQVLYRVSSDSPIVNALAKAAENGKQVSVLMELTARFDEENNIEHAQKLEAAGCHVVHGVMGLKTHAKALLIIRREASGIRRYVHLATGNYNEGTAKLYSDCGILTTREDVAEDVSHLFNVITGYSRPLQWRRLAVAPINLKDRIIQLIDNEIATSRVEMPGHIFAKMNSLLDKDIIERLYKASQKHVNIDLVIRGICALKPGVVGLSDNIRVKSIVGMYLEHSRLFRFKNGNNHQYFISSADWMPRNLYKRIEVMVPVTDSDGQAYIDEIIDFNLQDNVNSWTLNLNGEYTKLKHGGVEAFDLFSEFHRRYIERIKSKQMIKD